MQPILHEEKKICVRFFYAVGSLLKLCFHSNYDATSDQKMKKKTTSQNAEDIVVEGQVLKRLLENVTLQDFHVLRVQK